MTVIAFKDDVLAGDSLWTDGDFRATSKTKIDRLPNGLLYGGSGDNDDRALKTLLIKMKVPKKGITELDFPTVNQLQEINQNCTAMVICPITRRIYVVYCESSATDPADSEGNGVFEVTQPFYAVGHGSSVALGAMAAGASAEQAVLIACQFDTTCEPPVTKIELK